MTVKEKPSVYENAIAKALEVEASNDKPFAHRTDLYRYKVEGLTDQAGPMYVVTLADGGELEGATCEREDGFGKCGYHDSCYHRARAYLMFQDWLEEDGKDAQDFKASWASGATTARINGGVRRIRS